MIFSIEVKNSDLHRALEEAVKGPFVDPHTARRASRAASLLAELLGVEQRALAFLDEESTSASGQSDGADRELRGLSVHEAAREVLRMEGRPLHALTLSERMKRNGWAHPRSREAHESQLYHQLSARLPQFPKIFKKVGKATWALTEWDDVSS